MSTAVDYNPKNLDFGLVDPLTSGPDVSTFGEATLPNPAGGISLAAAPSDATLAVQITDGSTHFQIRDVCILDYVDEFPNPPGSGGGEGPPSRSANSSRVVSMRMPKPTKVLEMVDQFTGFDPVPVKAGQIAMIRTKYYSGLAEGSYSGTLLVTSDAWDPIQVPLALTLSQVVTTCSDVLNIAVGHQASLAFKVQSLMGPAMDISYEMSTTQLHTGLTLLTNGFQLDSKETKAFSLMFQADPDAPLGQNDIALVQHADKPMGFFFKANIVEPAVTVNTAIPNRLQVQRNTPFVLPIQISLNQGRPAGIDFSTPSLPNGVSFDSASVGVDSDTTISKTLLLDDAAPERFDLTILWSVPDRNQSGTLDIPVQVHHDTLTFDTGYMATKHPLGGYAQIQLRDNGTYTVTGHAHNSGFDNLDYTIKGVLMAPSGKGFSFDRSSNVEGTVAGLPFGTPQRDDDFEVTDHNDQIPAFWDDLQMDGTKFIGNLDGTDTTAGLIKQLTVDFGLAVGATVVGNLFGGSSSNDGDKNKGNDGNTATGTAGP